jgi:sugar O-acyltransferase (sialic acid O-acetyltransferase NeuD family)
MISPNVTINALAKIGIGAICNTYSIIEHECIIGDFAHIAPGAVLCGNVKVGENSFVGAKSVIRENITIGKNVIIGAGSVVVKDIPDNVKVVGNPARIIKYN